MEPLQIIEVTLRSLARRRRMLRALDGLFRGAVLGGVVWLAAVGLFKLLPIPPAVPLAAGWAAAACALAGLVAGGWRSQSLLETAQWVDQTGRLQERLSTAWEVGGQSGKGRWRDLLLGDAAAQAARLSPASVLPFRLSPSAPWAMALLLAAALAGLLPERRTPAQLQKEAERRTVVETGREIAELTRRQLAERRPVLEPTEKTLNEVAEFGDRLKQVSATRNEALKDLAALTQKVQDQYQKMGEKPALRTMERAAREPGGSAGRQDLSQRMDALKQAMGAAAGKNEAMEKLRKDLEALKQSAAAAPKGDSADAKAAQEKLSQSLKDLAQQARDAGIPVASLDEAAEALRNAETDFFLRDLNTALQELDKLQELGKNLMQLQNEMAKTARDLAEQLQQGQAKSAQATLERMIQQLKSANLGAEDLKKITDEVQKSLDPARQYGQVADHLRKALQQMPGAGGKGGDRGQASQHLEDAAKELGNLLQQAQDADQMAGALETLQRAQMSIASGRGFGQCKAQRPGFGRGGKPGRGVGTWADEEGWTEIPQENQGWDNSGVKQAELDPRGVSDRGEGERNDALSPTKVRGQMSPGGSMQSVTLRGVHIRGQSHVSLQEAAAAAQADAQSALNQDKVPRAYREGVRDYFDELKP